MFEIGMFACLAVIGYVLYMLYDHLHWGIDETTLKNTQDKKIWQRIFGGKER